MKNTDHIKDIQFEELTKEEYTIDEISEVLEISKGRAYYNINKFSIPSITRRGAAYFARESVIYLVRCVNSYIDDAVFYKHTNLYPSRRRLGRYKDYYREIEVMYVLGITEEELQKLTSANTLTFVPFSKNGKKRGGYSIKQVHEYAVSIGKTRFISGV